MVQESEGKTGTFRAVVIDGKIVGSISIEQNSDIYIKTGIIGYMLLDEYWNKGIMSETVKEICDIAFQELDIIRITGRVIDGNDASIRVLEKNHFEFEGTLKDNVFKDGEIKDEHIYRKLKD
jgi:ribosomal-protein-alanine N-acetyltransferase